MTEAERNEFVKIIREIVKQEISKIRNLEYSYFGTISADRGSGKFDVSIASSNGVYSSLLNKSGVSLSVGNAVIIRAKDGNMGNAYIAIKCG